MYFNFRFWFFSKFGGLLCGIFKFIWISSIRSQFLELVKTAVENETLLIVISNSGETHHLIELIQMVTERNLEVIAFVNARYSLVGSSARLTISSDSSSIRSFQEFTPSLFFGNTLSQFELLMSETLKSLSNQTFNDVAFFYQKTTSHIFGLVVLF